MGYFSRKLSSEKRTVTNRDPTAQGLKNLFGVKTQSGTNVNNENALRYTAVFAAIRVISESVASLPIGIYQFEKDSKILSRDHELFELLRYKPNNEMDAYTFKETLMIHLLTYGNAYAEIEYDKKGIITGLWPVHPGLIKLYREKKSKELYYEVRIDGKTINLPSYKILHIKGLSFNGLEGLSPIALARQAIGLGLATEEFGARFFGQGTHSGGIVELPPEKIMSDEAYNRLKDSMNEKYSGLGKSHRLLILEEGAKFNRVAIPPNEAQFLESRKFQLEEIARIYRVPPHMLQSLDRATFSNIEQQSIDFVTHSLRPWIIRWEQAITNKLLFGKERKLITVEFNMDALLRGDIKSRYEAHAKGRQWGWLSANDVRKIENMNPVEGLSHYLEPLNMVPAGKQLEIINAKRGGTKNEGENKTNSKGNTKS